MKKGTLYSMVEFKSKFGVQGETRQDFIDRELSQSDKSNCQLYRYLNSDSVKIFKSNNDIEILK